MSEESPLYTIGHSNHELEALLALLQRHQVTAVADVRSAPYSRRNPHFRRQALQDALEAWDIAYLFLGKELGGRAQDPHLQLNGRADYRKLERTPWFHGGIARLHKSRETRRVALLCAEREPANCHRALLIGRHLRGMLPILHILADGSLQTHEALEQGLLDLHRLRPSLFVPRDQLIGTAYELQADRVAHRSPLAPAAR